MCGFPDRTKILLFNVCMLVLSWLVLFQNVGVEISASLLFMVYIVSFYYTFRHSGLGAGVLSTGSITILTFVQFILLRPWFTGEQLYHGISDVLFTGFLLIVLVLLGIIYGFVVVPVWVGYFCGKTADKNLARFFAVISYVCLFLVAGFVMMVCAWYLLSIPHA